MKPKRTGMLLALAATATALSGQVSQAAPPTFSIILQGRTACTTPSQTCQARADGGFIDVTATANSLSALLMGTVAANAHLGTTGEAAETFQLVQEFDIVCSDPAVKTATVTLESALVGYIRSRYRAGAHMRLASAVVRPVNWDNSPLSLAHPMQAVEGKEAHLCNQHLPPLTIPSMPVGRYVLQADFLIDAVAGGLCDGHAVADFSRNTALPADWVRTRDPFQGVDKKNFGFALNLAAGPDNSSPATLPAQPSAPEVINTSATVPKPPRRATPIPADAKGFERITQSARR